jgi:hypothetical protein
VCILLVTPLHLAIFKCDWVHNLSTDLASTEYIPDQQYADVVKYDRDTSAAHTHEQSPPRTLDTGAPKFLQRIVQRVWDVVEVEGILLEQLVVDSPCYLRTVGISHRPIMRCQRRYVARTNRTNRMVPITFLNPQNSIDAARCMVWSGAFRSPFAVLYALRKANTACGILSCMMSSIVKRPSWCTKALLSGSGS